MNKPTSRLSLSRRNFLKWAAVTGVAATAAAGGYVVYEYPPWLNYDQQAIQTWRPLERSAPLSAQMLELVRYAALAANGHNTQPWKFAVRADAIEIHADPARALPAVDPAGREQWISLGCALENLLVAARAAGYAPTVTYPGAADYIQVRLSADTAQSGALFDAIPVRQNTRSVYDGQPIPSALLDQVQALTLEPGVTLRWVTNPAGLATVLEYVNQGNLTQYADQAYLTELLHWLRFNKREALASLDGLYTLCSGNPEVPRWIGQLVVGGSKPQAQADTDAAKLRSSPAAVVVVSDTDDKAAWVRTGQVYERLALTLTSLNLKLAFLNQPIEVGAVRGQFQTAMGLGASLPQLLVRCGYAAAMPRSLRRPVEQILM